MEAPDRRTEPVAPWATEQSPVEAPAPVPDGDSGGDTFAEHPEVFVGAAFAGGIGVALVLKWLGSR